MGHSLSLGPGKEDVLPFSAWQKEIGQFRLWEEQVPRQGSQEEPVSPGAVNVLGEEGTCERRRIEGVGE